MIAVGKSEATCFTAARISSDISAFSGLSTIGERVPS
uniref:Uncharacterized protein n=1 Tax=Arundo donax TaxID=35708 RepID=A0A0A9E7R6_ARUDO